jgi:uncharacterized protein YbdZ (MbtH family)
MSFGDFAANVLQRILDWLLPEQWVSAELRKMHDPWAIVKTMQEGNAHMRQALASFAALSMHHRELENEVRHLRQDNALLRSQVACLDAQAALWRRFISMPRGRSVGRNAEGFWQLWLHPSPSPAGWDLQEIGYDPVDVVECEHAP